MDFGEALQKLKDGYKVKRAIWGGYWELSWAQPFELIIIAWLKDGGAAPAQPYQADLLAEDWEVID